MNTRIDKHPRTSALLSPNKVALLRCGLLLSALGYVLGASAQTVTTTTNFSVAQMIPDGSASGLASSKMVSTPIAYITKVNVALKLSGTWNGDLYCFLSHSSGRSVLLNRVGRSDASSLGYGDEGFDVTFDDAGNDVHNYRLQASGNQLTPILGELTGVWAPDGRTTSPYTVLDTDPRPASLSSFNGLNPNGEWVLFLADVESGDVFTLDSWGLEITGYTPPSIAAQPVNTSIECSTGSASFNVVADGTAPLGFQWRFNGAPIPGATSSVLNLSNVNFGAAGSYDVVITNNYGTLVSSAAALTVVDTTAPVITLLGASPLYVECHGSFSDPGATASDSCAGDLTASIAVGGSVNVNVPGTYTVTYNVSDAAANAAVQVTRTVIVRDSIAPAVTLVGAASMTNECHSAFTDPGATADDNCAGSLSVVTSGSVNPNAVGVYTLTYTATDPSGNVGSATRTVYVIDTIAPSLIVPANITVFTTNTSGTAVNFTVSATDACFGPIVPSANPASGSTFGIGTTTVNVSATDGSGNISNSSFTVTVVLNHAPVARNSTLGAVENQARSVLIAKLLAKATDADGDALSISAVSANSTNGGSVALSGAAITYTPAANFVGTDSFSYTIEDGRGGMATGLVVVQVYSADAITPNITGISMSGGVCRVRFAGIPGFTYHVERTANMSPANWSEIGSVVAPDNGQVEYVDSNPLPLSGYYRTACSLP